jgi:hypothetical protein
VADCLLLCGELHGEEVAWQTAATTESESGRTDCRDGDWGDKSHKDVVARRCTAAC